MAEATLKLNWTNAAEIRRIIDALPAKIEKKVWRKATRAAAKVIAPRVKALTPVKTGLLRRNIKVRALRRSRKYVGARVTVGTKKTGEWYQGKTFYGAFQEFGWKVGKRPSKGQKDTRTRQIEGKHYMEKGGEQAASSAIKEFVRVAEMELKTLKNG